MKGIDLSKHFSLTSANEIFQIYSPLNDIRITYFNYIKIYNNDGPRELLTSNPYWIEQRAQELNYNLDKDHHWLNNLTRCHLKICDTEVTI